MSDLVPIYIHDIETSFSTRFYAHQTSLIGNLCCMYATVNSVLTNTLFYVYFFIMFATCCIFFYLEYIESFYKQLLWHINVLQHFIINKLVCLCLTENHLNKYLWFRGLRYCQHFLIFFIWIFNMGNFQLN